MTKEPMYRVSFEVYAEVFEAMRGRAFDRRISVNEWAMRVALGALLARQSNKKSARRRRQREARLALQSMLANMPAPKTGSMRSPQAETNNTKGT